MLFDGFSMMGGASTTTSGTDEEKKQSPKPKIALALGSGSARGWAHIGIIKALTKAGIEPDIIVGTSIGALVGGCEAAGILPALEEFALSLTRRRVFSLLDIPWRGGGLIGGNKLNELLETLLQDKKIEDLARPFASVATELATGHEIWLRQGNLANAMRASYALPGIFPPVQIHGKWLIDGAVVNPIPVSVCRAMGAKYVIAINLNNDPISTGTVIQNPSSRKKRKSAESNGAKALSIRQLLTGTNEGPGISAVMVAAYTISQDRLARSRMAGDPPDMVIAPKATDIGLFDFDKAKEAISAGEEAAERAIDEIQSAIAVLDD